MTKKLLFNIFCISSVLLMSSCHDNSNKTMSKPTNEKFAVQMNEGGNSGGGGTSVRSQQSKALLLWDLIANNPIFSEPEVGDQISLSTSVEIQKVSYSNFKSFQLLKSMVDQIQFKNPNLFKIIANDNFLIGDGTLSLFATSKYVKNLEELFVNDSFSAFDYVVFPLAYFDELTSFIYLNIDLWNQMGPISQAGFLLHERLRQLQLIYPQLSNEMIQGIVFYILDRETSVLLGYKPNDESLNFEKQKSSFPPPSGDAYERFKQLVQLGVFINLKTPIRDPKTIGRRNLNKTIPSGVILQPENCSNLISGFESIHTTYRSKLYCSREGLLAGVGGIGFTSPYISKQVIIDVVASLYSPNDGGSEIQVHFSNGQDSKKGLNVVIANHGKLWIHLNQQSAQDQLTKELISDNIMKGFNTYRFIIDRESKKLSVYVITKFQLLLLASTEFEGDLKLDEMLRWTFSINNNSHVQKIQINQQTNTN